MNGDFVVLLMMMVMIGDEEHAVTDYKGITPDSLSGQIVMAMVVVVVVVSWR